MTQQHSITPPPELVREWQREANHNEPMFPQVAAKAAEWGADQVAATLHMADLIMAFCESVKGTFLEEDRSSNFPSENCVSTDYRSLCIRLLNALDSGNAKAEEHVLCQIRQAINEETP